MLHGAKGAPSVTVSQDKRLCGACFRISHSEFYLAGAGTSDDDDRGAGGMCCSIKQSET